MVQSKKEQLLKAYVDVCNQAIQQNKDRFPFKYIFDAAQKDGADTSIEVHISGECETGAFVFHVSADGIIMKKHDECGACDCVRKWSVNKSFLEQVEADPQFYVTNPAKIDWEWMYDAY